MKKLFLGLMLATFILPAKAALNEDDQALLVAKLTVYEIKCGALPPKVQEIAELMAGMVSQSKLITATNQLNELLRNPGATAAFCATWGNDMKKLEDSWRKK